MLSIIRLGYYISLPGVDMSRLPEASSMLASEDTLIGMMQLLASTYSGTIGTLITSQQYQPFECVIVQFNKNQSFDDVIANAGLQCCR